MFSEIVTQPVVVDSRIKLHDCQCYVQRYNPIVLSKHFIRTLSAGVSTLNIAYIHVDPERSFGETNGESPSEASQLRKGVPGSSPGKFQKPTLQMVQSTLFLGYICEYY